MRTIVRDPLLAAARVLLTLLIAIVGLAAALVLLAAPFVLIMQDRVIAEMTADSIANAGALVTPLAGFLLCIALFLAAGVWFLVLLKRIVRSVGEGDPFAPVNAVRLARMGWIALLGQIAGLPFAAAALWLKERMDESTSVTFDTDVGISVAGLLLVLTLFILARVFRHGAAMREDLEGTV